MIIVLNFEPPIVHHILFIHNDPKDHFVGKNEAQLYIFLFPGN